MQELEKKLNYTFRNQELLREALNHSSYANEHRSQGLGSNERLEFLGDSVLGFVTAEYLFARHPDLPEGDLTRIRAALVCEQSLHEVAQKLNLGSYLKLGKGEEAGGGRHRASILADATEAVFAAVYLDGGITAASELIHRVLLDVERETLETALVDALRQAFRHLCAPETYLDDYRQLCLNLGRQVHILQTDETVTALDIDPQYGLVVRHGSGAVETLRCGEVSVRGLYGYAE